MKRIEEIQKKLKEHGLRVTNSRKAVATILLQNQERLLSSEEIFSKISTSKDLSCDQVSVYRILTTFEELGIVTKNTFSGDASRYKLLPFGGKHVHQHFFKCTSCKAIEPLKGCFATKKEKELESKGYSNLSHHFEITGLCPSCN